MGYYFLLDNAYDINSPYSNVSDVIVVGNNSVRFYSENYSGGDGNANHTSLNDIIDAVLSGEFHASYITYDETVDWDHNNPITVHDGERARHHEFAQTLAVIDEQLRINRRVTPPAAG